jgi:anaerobic selenocysteine-containing dehydrogenase
MGATGNVSKVFLDNLEEVFQVPVHRPAGLDAIGTIRGLFDGGIRGFLGLGGNFGVAVPDSPRVLAALERTDLTVHIATKLNRTHLFPGKIGLLLPSLGRTDIDARSNAAQNTAVQVISVEDSMSMTHASGGIKKPLSDDMMGEPAIVCGIGAALADSNGTEDRIGWRSFADDYSLIRDRIEMCVKGVTSGFTGYNTKLLEPGGFHLVNYAAERRWKTASGRAEFRVHQVATDGHIQRARIKEPLALVLMTIRSHDQFNTTVYSLNDRYRGIFGGRHVILMNADDIAERKLKAGAAVDIETVSDDGIERVVHNFQVVEYDIPRGCTAAYFPEATPLIPVDLVSTHTATPAYKEIPVMVRAR